MSAGAVRMGRAFVEIGADPSKLFRGLQQANRRIGQFGQNLSTVGTRMMAAGAAMAAPLALAARGFAAFDDQVRLTGAVSGASGAELQKLSDRARFLGETTSFTATEVARLMTELGRAGFSVDEINTMSAAVLNLARATGTDATLSAEIMVATLRQFSLGAGEATRVADVLTLAANATNASVEGLGESLKFAGPVAANLGMSLEDTVAIIGTLANVGIQGSEAGTALRRLGVIAAGSGEQLEKLFGVSNTDADGNLKPLVDILDEINTATADMPVAERTARMAKAFGLLGITSANVLSGTAGGVRELAAQLSTADGVAARTAKEMDAGLGGSARIALSAVDGLRLAVGEALAPALVRALDAIREVAGGLTEMVKRNQDAIVLVAKGVATFLAAGAAFLAMGKALQTLSFIAGLALTALSLLLTPFGALIAALTAFSVAAVRADGALGDLTRIAYTTFSGIYHAIVAGDLAGAMDLLWLGWYAAWLRGIESLLNQWDEFVALGQNTMTFFAAHIVVAWEIMWASMTSAADLALATVVGAFEDSFNKMVEAAKAGVLAIAIVWLKLQTKLNPLFTDDEAFQQFMAFGDMLDRVTSPLAMPGSDARTAAAREREAARAAAGQEAAAAALANAEEIAAGRMGENAARAAARRAASQRAEAELEGRVRDAAAGRVFGAQAAELLANIQRATSIEQLRDLYGEYEALSQNGRMSAAQATAIEDALDDAQERISRGGVGMGAARNIRDGAAAGGVGGGSQADVVGTFSASVAGLGFGSTLQQQMADYARRTAEATEEIADEVAPVAAA